LHISLFDGVVHMFLQYTKLDNGVHLLKLTGRLDIIGTGEIETKFAGYCAVEKGRVLVDLSGVDFLASIGIRLLVVNAKALAARGGRMIVLNARPEVRKVLEIAGIPAIIPMYENLESALAVLGV
jgi:anti-sigma B factor antagonist